MISQRVPRSPALDRRLHAIRRGEPSSGRPRRRPRRRPASGAPWRALLLLLALGALTAGWRWWHGSLGPQAQPDPASASALDGSVLQQARITVGLPPGSAAGAAPAAAPAAGSAAGARAVLPVLPGLPAAQVDAGLQSLVEREIDDENGATAVAVRNLRTGATAVYHEGDVFPSASLSKVPILLEVFHRLDAGTLRPDQQVTIAADAITDGAGVLQARVGEKLTVAELLHLTVTVSDNVAARLLVREVGGTEAVNRAMADLGYSQTRLYSDDRPNTTTAAEMATLLAALSTTQASPPAVAAAGAAGATPVAGLNGGLPALLALPQAQAWLADGVPKGVPVAHKSGQLPGVRHDAGIVVTPRGSYVLVVLTQDLADQSSAETFLTRLSHDVYDYFTKAA